MRLLLIDNNEATRQVLMARIQEALRRSGLRRVQVIEGDADALTECLTIENPSLTFFGPGCYRQLDELIDTFRSLQPTAPLAVVLDNEIYANEAIELRKSLQVRLMPIADIAQIAQFILEVDSQLGAGVGGRNRGVVTAVQFKGGIGTSTVAASLAACWAKNDLSVALVDLDDLNPQITDWAQVGAAQRKAVSDALREGDVPRYRLDELGFPVEGYDGRLVIIGQPEHYSEGFHLKADVLEGAPSSAEYLKSLISVLQDEFDVIVVDAGRSWGVATFALLPLSQHVLMVTSDEQQALKRSLDNLQRLYSESDDFSEFDLARWRVVLNGFSGRGLSVADVSKEIEDVGIFPQDAALYTIPFCDSARRWSGSKETLFEKGDEQTQAAIREIAFNLVPFRLHEAPARGGILKKKLKRLVGEG
jgi:cellulose biosynthesis protein BcsQ